MDTAELMHNTMMPKLRQYIPVSKVKRDVITVLDENGFEILVDASWEPVEPDADELLHGAQPSWNIDLYSVELVFAKKGIEVLPLLDLPQRKSIKEKVIDFINAA